MRKLLLVAVGVVAVLPCIPLNAVAYSPGGPGGGGQGGGSGGGPGDPRITLTVGNMTAVEGSDSSGDIRFADADPNATAAEYAATIDWGDGTGRVPEAIVRVNSGAGGPALFSVPAVHNYATVGTYTVCAEINDPDRRSEVSQCGSAQVAEATVALRGVTDALTNPYCGAVAIISDGNRRAWIGEYTATIEWGDGTTSNAGFGEIGRSSDGATFAVQGCHTYVDLGPYPVTTTLFDFGTLVTSATSTAWVYAITDGGTFVIGDGNAAVGNGVTFWGSTWASANTLSAGPAPDSFKGFAEATVPTCVGTWSSKPGASSAPPAKVPSYTAMLVVSNATKVGSHVDGNSVHVALVRTDSGYDADPGHAGTGTVVFMIC